MYGDPELILQELSNELMSPYCPGRTISACPSENARKLEDHILAEARSGKSREEIETQLVGRFGTDIIGYAPQPFVIYGSLFVGLVALGALGWAGRKWVRGGRGAARNAAAAGAAAAAKPSRAEFDALDDALDEEDGF